MGNSVTHMLTSYYPHTCLRAKDIYKVLFYKKGDVLRPRRETPRAPSDGSKVKRLSEAAMLVTSK